MSSETKQYITNKIKEEMEKTQEEFIILQKKEQQPYKDDFLLKKLDDKLVTLFDLLGELTQIIRNLENKIEDKYEMKKNDFDSW